MITEIVPYYFQATIAGGDATSPNQTVKNASVNGAAANPQPSLALAGVITYINEGGVVEKIPFGEKDRAANCLHTLCQGDKVMRKFTGSKSNCYEFYHDNFKFMKLIGNVFEFFRGLLVASSVAIYHA